MSVIVGVRRAISSHSVERHTYARLVTFLTQVSPDSPSSYRFATRNQNPLADLHPETDRRTCKMSSSSAFARSVKRPTGYHTRSPNTHLQLWCPRPRHRSNSTLPSHPTVSRFSNVVAFPSHGLRFWWYLHLAVELKFCVLTWLKDLSGNFISRTHDALVFNAAAFEAVGVVGWR